MSRRRFLEMLAVVAVGALAAIFLVVRANRANHTLLTLYGNIDIREVQLAFNDSDRITRMLVEEGDFVRPGELLAELDARRYAANAEQARRNIEAQQQVLARLINGSRPEEIVQARSTMEALHATMRDAEVTYQRDVRLRRKDLIPQQELDDAASKLKETTGNYNAARQAWILAVKGPRIEDIENARAVLKADEAAFAFAQRELADTKLYAHSDGIIEDRILEPGDMASPGVPAFTMALTNPLWVRAYVPETYMARIYLSMKASITTDSFPGKVFKGWIGYISPTAEFTPKNVETPELRTRLVYQVRVYACNPQNELRLGMPATVTVALDQPIPSASQVNGLGCGEHNHASEKP
ncbi:MAG TPA: efflux RND transporter periplasmic adaptor subunit [Candidatus Binataceae bacterium]|nr:efflux RND transporter periplasmic adaptor subunit [Candidatus Binataceae bacterium]